MGKPPLLFCAGSEDMVSLLEGIGTDASQWSAGSAVSVDGDGDGTTESYTPYTLGNARILVAGGATPASLGGVRNTAPAEAATPTGSGSVSKDAALPTSGYSFAFTDAEGGSLHFYASLRIDGNGDGDFDDTGMDVVIGDFAVGTEATTHRGVSFTRTSAAGVSLGGAADTTGTWSFTITASDGIAATSSDFTLIVGAAGNNIPVADTTPTGSGSIAKDEALSAGGYSFSFSDADSGDTLSFSASLRIDGNGDGDVFDTSDSTDIVVPNFAVGTTATAKHGVSFTRTSGTDGIVSLTGSPDTAGTWSLTITASDGTDTTESVFALTVRGAPSRLCPWWRGRK